MVPLLLLTAQTGFAFGRVGGNIMPFTVTISTSGAVTTSGPAPARLRKLTKRQLAVLNRAVVETSFAQLPAVTACPNTLPDVAAQFIRVGGRTVRVHGSCLARFNRLWAALSKATAE
jgi:hypothetical protein